MHVAEPYPVTTVTVLRSSDASLTVKLGYPYQPSYGQCSHFVLLTDPESSKEVVPCSSKTNIQLDGLHSNTNYQVVVTAVASFSGKSVSSVRKITKSWTCKLSFYRIYCMFLSPHRMHFIHGYLENGC